jgi:hypothetical protein
MSANDLPEREQRRAHVAGLLATLGKPYEVFRPVWAGADNAARRAMLKIAGMPEIWYCREWDGLGRTEKEKLQGRVLKMRDWLNSHLAGVEA